MLVQLHNYSTTLTSNNKVNYYNKEAKSPRKATLAIPILPSSHAGSIT